MFRAKRIILTGGATLAALLWTASAIAEEQSASSPAPSSVATASTTSSSYLLSSPVSAPAATRRNPFASQPVPADALAAKRGGALVFNDNQLKGVVADNQASNLTTGMNVISDGAFSGSSGMPTVIQNSGNNVLIQNATIVNVQVK